MNRHAHLIGVVLVAIAIAVFPLVDGNAFHLKVLFMIAVNYLAAAGLNVLVGHTGQKSLGHAGLFAVGAYTVALLTTRGEWNPWLAFVASGFAAALFGVVIALPALRVKGPALAMVTIGFGIVVEKVVSRNGRTSSRASRASTASCRRRSARTRSGRRNGSGSPARSRSSRTS
jgi:branched-chain amino acid transport system permease protein